MSILEFIGRPAHFEANLKENRRRLYRLAYSWCHSKALADDLVQEAMSKALAKPRQLREPGLFLAWLFSILANCWRDHLRRHKPTEDVDTAEGDALMMHETPEDSAHQSQVVAKVRRAVAELPAGQREVLTLVDLEECSYAEVAAILDIPVGTVMSRLSRARAALKEKLVHCREPKEASFTNVARLKC